MGTMHGTLVELELEVVALAGNPLGDPSRRTVLVYLPPCHGARPLPAVYFLHGFSGSARGWRNASLFQPTVPERIDAADRRGRRCRRSWRSSPTASPGWAARSGSTPRRWVATRAYVAEASWEPWRPASATDPLPRGAGGGGEELRRLRRAVHGARPGRRLRPRRLPLRRRRLRVLLPPRLPEPRRRCWAPTPVAAGSRRPPGARGRPSCAATTWPSLNVLAMAAAYSPEPGAPLGLALPFELPTGRLRARGLVALAGRRPGPLRARRRCRLPEPADRLPGLRHPRRVPPALGGADGGGVAPARRGGGRPRGVRGRPHGRQLPVRPSLALVAPRLAQG